MPFNSYLLRNLKRILSFGLNSLYRKLTAAGSICIINRNGPIVLFLTKALFIVTVLLGIGWSRGNKHQSIHDTLALLIYPGTFSVLIPASKEQSARWKGFAESTILLAELLVHRVDAQAEQDNQPLRLEDYR